VNESKISNSKNDF